MGAPVTAQRRAARRWVACVGVRLADGRHRVSVEATAGGIFGGQIRRSWTINVDTRRPSLRIAGVPNGWLRSDTLNLRGLTEAGSRIEVRAGTATAGREPPPTEASRQPPGGGRIVAAVGDGT